MDSATAARSPAIGVGQAYHGCGYNGYDGLVRITPDGKLHVHTGVGNLGTYSYASTSRAAAEVLNCSWENTIIERGDSRRGLPWNLTQDSSNTSFTMARTNYAAAMDAKAEAVRDRGGDLGGKAADYDLGRGAGDPPARCVARRSPSPRRPSGRSRWAAATAATRCLPTSIRSPSRPSPGSPARDSSACRATSSPPEVVPTSPAPSSRSRLDAETGEFEIIDIVCVSDCGVVMHPKGLEVQLKSASVQGIGTRSPGAPRLRRAPGHPDPRVDTRLQAAFLSRRSGEYRDRRGRQERIRGTR